MPLPLPPCTPLLSRLRCAPPLPRLRLALPSSHASLSCYHIWFEPGEISTPHLGMLPAVTSVTSAGEIPTPHLGMWRSGGRPEPPPAETLRLCYQNCYQVLKKGMLDVHHGAR